MEGALYTKNKLWFENKDTSAYHEASNTQVRLSSNKVAYSLQYYQQCHTCTLLNEVQLNSIVCLQH